MHHIKHNVSCNLLACILSGTKTQEHEIIIISNVNVNTCYRYKYKIMTKYTMFNVYPEPPKSKMRIKHVKKTKEFNHKVCD